MSWLLLRPDSVAVWKDPAVNERLSWYKDVMLNRAQAKFLIAKSIAAEARPEELSERELWELHSTLREEFERRWEEAKRGKWFKEVKNNFLDVKVELAKRLLGPLVGCARGAARWTGGRPGELAWWTTRPTSTRPSST